MTRKKDSPQKSTLRELMDSKRQTMRTYANFKKYERMRLTVIAKTSRFYHRRSIRYDTGRTQYQRKRHYPCFCCPIASRHHQRKIRSNWLSSSLI